MPDGCFGTSTAAWFKMWTGSATEAKTYAVSVSVSVHCVGLLCRFVLSVLVSVPVLVAGSNSPNQFELPQDAA